MNANSTLTHFRRCCTNFRNCLILKKHASLLASFFCALTAVPSAIAQSNLEAVFQIGVNQITGVALLDNRSNCVENTVFKTIQNGLDCALRQKKQGVSTVLNIDAGTYRASAKLWMPENNVNTTPMLIRASGGKVTLSGSDLFADWTELGGGLYQRQIPGYPLSLSPQLDESPMPRLTRYRELVFADGRWLAQIESDRNQQSGDGTFKVNRANGTVTIAPHDGVLNNPQVEVGVRDFVWRQDHVHDVTIENLIMQHATTQWDKGVAAVAVADSDRARLNELTIHWNNGDGLFLSKGENVTVDASVANYNGKGGMGAFQLYESLIVDSVTNRNNWRGNVGGYYSWWVGNKFTYSRGLTIRNHYAADNFSRGLWLDLDNEDVLIENALVLNNQLDGIFLEVSQGPITITNSRFSGNGEHGIKGANAEKVTLSGVELTDNKLNQLRLTADGRDGPRQQPNHETGEIMSLWLEDWTIENSVIGNSTQSTLPLVRSTLIDDPDDDDWTRFLDSYKAQNNCYYHANNSLPFQIDDPRSVISPASLASWQSETAEKNSEFYSTSSRCERANIARLIAPVIDGYAGSEWDGVSTNFIANPLLGDSQTADDFSASFNVGYDDNNLYFIVTVLDEDLRNDSSVFWQDDNVELFIDAGNERSATYDNNDFHLIIGADGSYTLGSKSAPLFEPEIAVRRFDQGYVVEAAIPHTTGINAVAGYQFGLDVHITDDDLGGPRENKLSWYANIDDSWKNPTLFKAAVLQSR